VSYRPGDVILSSATSPAPRSSRSPTAFGGGRDRSDQSEASTVPIEQGSNRRPRVGPDLGPQGAAPPVRAETGRDRDRDSAQRGAEIDVGRARGEARDHPHLDRAANCCRMFGSSIAARRPRRRAPPPPRFSNVKGGRGDHHRGRRELRHLRHPARASMVVEKEIGGKAGLPLLICRPASYVGEMAADRRPAAATATVRAPRSSPR